MSEYVRCRRCGTLAKRGTKKCPKCSKMKRKARIKKVIFLVVFLLLGALGTMKLFKNGITIKETPIEDSVEIVERPNEFLIKTVEELQEELEINLVDTYNYYVGRQLKVSGIVSDINMEGKRVCLSPTVDTLPHTVLAYTHGEFQEQVSKLEIGQELTLKVKVKDVGHILGYSTDIIEIVEE